LGDFNVDGTVDGADFSLLASHFGTSASGAVALPAADWAALNSFDPAAVPEPGSIGLVAAGVVMTFGRRRRRQLR
jgi:hypothetical protein